MLEMIKFEHTIFALPFAIMGAFLASDGIPELGKLSWIVVAMVGARSSAMAFNRLIDADFDRKNPRTSRRAIPAGLLEKSEVWIFTIVSAGLFFFAAYRLNSLAFKLSPIALGIITGYSYSKRFSLLAHLWLGLSLAIAPIGAWIAIRAAINFVPILLGFAVMLWTSGFDLIYACQDCEFDRKELLHSIPAKFGIKMALRISSIFHILTVGVLLLVGKFSRLDWIYFAGVAAVAAMLIYEHKLVKPDDLSKVNLAFFTINGMVSLVLMTLSIIDILIL